MFEESSAFLERPAFRTASPRTLSARSLNRPVSALWKSTAAVLQTAFLTSPKMKKAYRFMMAVPKETSNHHVTHRSFPVCKQQVKWGTFPCCFPHHLCPHTPGVSQTISSLLHCIPSRHLAS